MKINFLIVIFCAFTAIYSCNDSGKKGMDNTNATKSEDPDVEEGLNLIAKSDCLTCHQVEEQAIGPAYRAIAKKYRGNPEIIDTLADRIIKGSAGNWGAVPMNAHPSLSMEEASLMVKYILSLNENE